MRRHLLNLSERSGDRRTGAIAERTEIGVSRVAGPALVPEIVDVAYGTDIIDLHEVRVEACDIRNRRHRGLVCTINEQGDETGNEVKVIVHITRSIYCSGFKRISIRVKIARCTAANN